MKRLSYVSIALVLFACTDSAVVLTPDSGGGDASSDATVDAPSETGGDAAPDASSDDASDATVADAAPEAEAGLTCDAGLEVCNDTCVDPQTYQGDDKNCGFCGHDCQGNACNAGLCAPDTLGTDLPNPTALTVDAANVYFTTGGDFVTASGGVYQCPIAGCPTKLGAMTTGYLNPESIAVDGSSVYWGYTGDLGAATGGVSSCPIAGCGKGEASKVTIASNVQFVLGLAVDASNVYFGAWNASPFIDGTVDSCPLAGCTGAPNDVLEVQYKIGMVLLHGSDLYAASMGGGASVPYINQGALPGPSNGTRLYTGTVQNQMTSLALYAGAFYFTDGFQGTINVCPMTGCTNAPALVSNLSNPLSIAVDSKGIYWIDDSGIEFAPINGFSAPTLLATVSDPNNYPVALALGGNYLYWIEDDNNTGTTGAVLRVAR